MGICASNNTTVDEKEDGAQSGQTGASKPKLNSVESTSKNKVIDQSTDRDTDNENQESKDSANSDSNENKQKDFSNRSNSNLVSVESKTKEQDAIAKQRLVKYDKQILKILESKGKLDIPKELSNYPDWFEWFPKEHGHKKAKKIFKWREELGRGVTGIVYACFYKGKSVAVKKIEV